MRSTVSRPSLLAMTPRRPRLSPGTIDALLAFGLMALGFISRIEISDLPTGSTFSREPDAWNFALIAFQTLPIAFRRRWPVTVLAVVTAGFMIDRALDYPNTLASAGIVLAIHAIGSELPSRASMRIGFPYVVGLSAFTALGAWTLESVGAGDVIGTALIAGAPLYLGREVHERRLRLEQLQSRAELAEREKELRATEAVAEERARIARELHDVVAHQMAVMTLQAEGASRIATDSDPRVAEALQTIKTAGHSALTDMRRMVGLLRTPESSTDLAPMPSLRQVEQLVQTVKDAGLDVNLEIRGPARALDDGIELSAYRVIQESLTNVARHGGPQATANVTLAYSEDGIDVEVVDTGRGAASKPSEEGHGIIGMRERVAVLQGEFDAGPKPGGGFRVRAHIPHKP